MTADAQRLREVRDEFERSVNMTNREMERWLETEESRSAGWDPDGDGESVGHEMGRHIVELRNTPKDRLTEEDLGRMRKVIGYVHRHLAQGGPKEDVEHSRWRHSLMNWGHDPLKD
jgi:hypothetical protein